MKNAYRASSNIRFASVIAISIGMGLLGTTASLAADKVGVSMPNVKGPWFTPVLYGISDEAKKPEDLLKQNEEDMSQGPSH